MKNLKLLLIFLFIINFLEASPLPKKRILYINSYHTGLSWSDGIEKSIKNTLKKSGMPIQFKRIEMDTKRNSKESYKLKIAQKVKSLIDDFKPDVVITSDDNAAKYVIVPYFKDSSIPFVFCGINASAKKYGFPSKNVTGMIEVQLVSQIVDSLKEYSKGTKISYLKGDSLSSRIEASFFEEQLNQKIDKRFVNSVEEWKENFIDLQNSSDILLIGNGGAIEDWNENKKSIINFVRDNTKIPSGSWDTSVSDIVLLTYANKPEEQGTWAANTALQVLKGVDIVNIPIIKNEKASIYINIALGKKLNILFPFDVIDNAKIVK